MDTNHDFIGCDVVHRALLTEVSVLSPDRQPAEPCAHVLTLGPTKPKPEPTSSIAQHLSPDAAHPTTKSTSGYAAEWNPDVPAEVVLENMRAELHAAGDGADWSAPPLASKRTVVAAVRDRPLRQLEPGSHFPQKRHGIALGHLAG